MPVIRQVNVCSRQSLHRRPSDKSGHVGYAAESGSKFRALRLRYRPVRVDGAAREVIPASKPEPRIMRFELSDYEWTAIKPMLPNKPRGVRRVNDRRVLNGIFWVLHSGAPWRDLPATYGAPPVTIASFDGGRLASGIKSWMRLLPRSLHLGQQSPGYGVAREGPDQQDSRGRRHQWPAGASRPNAWRDA